MKLNKFVLIIILALGLFLRTYQLNVSPPGFNADEAALGYNAYSILKTGKDEWGERLPLVFKSFSDYKPGLYVYLDLPFVALLGLNETAVRLPSILFGTLTILILYYLTKEVTGKETLALGAAFILAVSPWHIHYSRGAWETNIATFFISLGVLAFILGLKKSKWWVVATISFIASMYVYQSPRVIVPILAILLVIVYWKRFLDFRKLLIPVLISFILILPLVFIIFSNKGLARFQGVSIFTDIGPGVKNNEERGKHKNQNSLVIKFYHNKIIPYSLNFFDHYLDHYTPNFLFASGDPLGRNKTPEMGQMYLFEILTLLFGVYYLITRVTKNVKVILFWLLVAPIAASLTYQTPHALRAENMVVPLSLISGSGLGFLIERINYFRKFIRIPFFILVSFVIIFFILKFLHQYFVHLPKEYPLEWEYGFSQVVPKAVTYGKSYKKIVMTTRYDQPYILFLFYNQYNPARYQNSFISTSIDKFGFSTVSRYDKFEFRDFKKEEVDKAKGILFIGTEEQFPEYKKVLDKVVFPNGKTMVKFVGT